MLGSGSVFEAPAVVAGLDDVAVMVSRSSSAVVIPAFAGTRLGVAEDARPFGKDEVGGNDGSRTFIVSDKRSLRVRS